MSNFDILGSASVTVVPMREVSRNIVSTDSNTHFLLLSINLVATVAFGTVRIPLRVLLILKKCRVSGSFSESMMPVS